MLTYLKFRWQRLFRRQSRKLKAGWRQLTNEVRLNTFGKWRHLRLIRRFVLSWWLLVGLCLLGTVWQTRHMLARTAVLHPKPGGTYSEGVVGSVKIINPILPDNSASADAVRLIFNGLTRFDASGDLKADLATNWTISPDGKTYTFTLRKNVHWHDGVPFTAQDVVFTLAAIQNPDTRSPLAASWKGVQAEAVNDNTVRFVLPKPYTPFINLTTVGILPRHSLENVEPSTLRVDAFNQKPIGTGPFQLDEFNGKDGEVILKANQSYFAGRPLLDGITLRSYDTANDAYKAYTRRQVMGVARLPINQISAAKKSGRLKIYEAGVPDEVGVFFHTSEGVTADKAVRGALAAATDRKSLIAGQFNGQASPLSGPIVTKGLNLLGVPHQPQLDVTKANADLEAAGWKKGSDGVRIKDGKPLELKLITQSGTAYPAVAKALQQQWEKVGARLAITEVDGATLQQSYIRSRHYDALLYGINVGADADVYSYWHSSQAADTGLNLSSYKSAAADQALEAGRTVRDVQTRSAKYRSFIQTWVADTPAVMLYTPTYLYAVDREVHGVHVQRLITPSDRFDNVAHWSVKIKSVQPHH
jgi:peptide/nickel transport system substrate-binding protein